MKVGPRLDPIDCVPAVRGCMNCYTVHEDTLAPTHMQSHLCTGVVTGGATKLCVHMLLIPSTLPRSHTCLTRVTRVRRRGEGRRKEGAAAHADRRPRCAGRLLCAFRGRGGGVDECAQREGRRRLPHRLWRRAHAGHHGSLRGAPPLATCLLLL